MNFETISDLLNSAVFAQAARTLTKVEQTILAGAWQNETYESIAESSQGYSVNYIKRDVGPKLWKLLSTILEQEVNKKNFRSVLEHLTDSGFFETIELNLPARIRPPDPVKKPSRSTKVSPRPHFDLGEAVNVAEFFGREPELGKLTQWVVADRAQQAEHHRCRVIALLGVGGIGKTSLAVKLVKKLMDDSQSSREPFDVVIWRSLQTAPSLDALLVNLLAAMTPDASSWATPSEIDSDSLIRQFMDCLHRHRCLLIFDSTEAILQTRRRAGRYREGYEKYGELIKRIGEEAHHSCLLLISREKPDEVALMEGAKLFVRSLKLDGLDRPAAHAMIEAKGFDITENKQTWDQLIEHYGGNPLALKIAATAIYELFHGEIAEFLYQGKMLFDKIYDLIEEQINRLSLAERTIINWLAVSQTPLSFTELQQYVLSPEVKRKFIGVLKSLKDRSLIEAQTLGFTISPAIRDYLLEQLIEQFAASLIRSADENEDYPPDPASDFNQYAIVRAQEEDPTIERQRLFLLRPILHKLMIQYGSQTAVAAHLQDRLAHLRHEPPVTAGYAGGNLVNLLRDLGTPFERYDFSHLTLWQARFHHQSLRNADFRNSDLSQAVFTETIGNILSLSYSSNGRFLAAGDSEGKVHIWESAPGSAKTLHKVQSWRGHVGWIRTIAFSPNHTAERLTVLTGSHDCTIKRWDIQTGQCLNMWGSKEWIRAVQFSPDGQTFVTASDDYAVKLWSLTEDQPLCTFSGDTHLDRVRSVVFSPDGRWLASASDDRTVILWDVAHRRSITRLEGHRDRVRSVAISADGQWVASGGDDCTVRLWQVSPDWQVTPYAVLKGHTDRVRSVTFSPNGEWVVSGGDDCLLKVWNRDQAMCESTLGQQLTQAIGRIQSVVFKPNSTLLVSGNDDQTLQFWDVSQQRCRRTLKGLTLSIQALQFIDDTTLLSGSDDQHIRLWDVEGQCYRMFSAHQGRITSLALAPLEASGLPLVVSGSDDCTVRLWNLKTGQCLPEWQTSTHWIRAISFSPERKLLAAAGDDCRIRLWEIHANGVCQSMHPLPLEGHSHWIRAIAFSPGGEWLASGGDDQFVRLWDVQRGDCKRVLGKHGHRIQAVAFSPDGRWLASAGDDATIRLWDLHTETLATTLEAEPEDVDCNNGVKTVVFSPDGTWLASGSDGAIVRLWDVTQLPEAHCCFVWKGHLTGVRAVAFSPNGAWLASSSRDGEIRLWDVQTGQYRRSLYVKGSYDGMNITGVRGLTEVQRIMLKELGAIDEQTGSALPTTAQ